MIISNIEATVRRYCLKKMLIVSNYLETMGTKRRKIRLYYGSGFSDTTVFSFQDASANELQRARRNLWEQH